MTRSDRKQSGLLRRVVALRWPSWSRRDEGLLRHWPDDLDVTIPPAPDL